MTNARTEIQEDLPVRKSVTVRTSAARAFQVFTEGLDTWWPRSHHIGESPLTKTILEGRVGGRCYSEQEDGTQCDWASVLVWEPPNRVVMAWQVTSAWKFEPDVAKASEVEVRFTEETAGTTRVDLEHRHFARHGAGGDKMRTQVGEPGGWTAILECFAAGTSDLPLLSAEETARAEQYLISTRDELLSAIDGLNAAQWNFKPGPDRWSIGEIAEHIAIVENRILAIVRGMQEAPLDDRERENSDIEEIILIEVPQRSTRFSAPAAIVPKNQWGQAETLERLRECRAETLRLLAEAPALRGHVVNHPVLGPWDGYQWILAVGAHAARHTDQIAELKACAEFPA